MTGIFAYLQALDERLLIIINHARNPLLDHIMKTASDFGLFFPVLAVFIFYRLLRGGSRERIMWIIGILAVVSSDALCARVLKPLAGRQRPFLDIDGIYVLKGTKWLLTTPEIRMQFGPSLSWPSCHAANMWTAASYLFRFMPRTGLAVAIAAALVTYSRVYLGVHYPFDCLGGMAVGIIWGSLAAFLARWVEDMLSDLPDPGSSPPGNK